MHVYDDYLGKITVIYFKNNFIDFIGTIIKLGL